MVQNYRRENAGKNQPRKMKERERRRIERSNISVTSRHKGEHCRRWNGPEARRQKLLFSRLAMHCSRGYVSTSVEGSEILICIRSRWTLGAIKDRKSFSHRDYCGQGKDDEGEKEATRYSARRIESQEVESWRKGRRHEMAPLPCRYLN